MAHALYSVAGLEGNEVIPGSALQETLVADLSCAGEPGRQEGVPPGAYRTSTGPSPKPRCHRARCHAVYCVLFGEREVAQAVREPARLPARLTILRKAASTIR